MPIMCRVSITSIRWPTHSPMGTRVRRSTDGVIYRMVPSGSASPMTSLELPTIAVNRRWFTVADVSATMRSSPNTRIRVTTMMTIHAVAHTARLASATLSLTSRKIVTASTMLTPPCNTRVCLISWWVSRVAGCFDTHGCARLVSAVPMST